MTDAWSPPSAASAWQNQQRSYSTPVASKKTYEPAAWTALGLAITSVFIWFIPAIVALFLASGAKRNINASADTRRGKEVALIAQLLSLFTILAEAGIVALLAIV